MDTSKIVVQHALAAVAAGRYSSPQLSLAVFRLCLTDKTRYGALEDLRKNHPVEAAEFEGLARYNWDARAALDEALRDGMDLVGMIKKGLLTPLIGRDHYAARFKGYVLMGVLELWQVNLLTPECGADWYAEHFGGIHDGYLLGDVLYRTGLLTPELGLDFYVRHFKRKQLMFRFETMPSLVRGKDAEWFGQHFEGEDLARVLKVLEQ